MNSNADSASETRPSMLPNEQSEIDTKQLWFSLSTKRKKEKKAHIYMAMLQLLTALNVHDSWLLYINEVWTSGLSKSNNSFWKKGWQLGICMSILPLFPLCIYFLYCKVEKCSNFFSLNLHFFLLFPTSGTFPSLSSIHLKIWNAKLKMEI